MNIVKWIQLHGIQSEHDSRDSVIENQKFINKFEELGKDEYPIRWIGELSAIHADLFFNFIKNDKIVYYYDFSRKDVVVNFKDEDSFILFKLKYL